MGFSMQFYMLLSERTKSRWQFNGSNALLRLNIDSVGWKARKKESLAPNQILKEGHIMLNERWLNEQLFEIPCMHVYNLRQF